MRRLILFPLASAIWTMTVAAASADEYQLSAPHITVSDRGATTANGRAIVPALECDSCTPVTTPTATERATPLPQSTAPPAGSALVCSLAEMPLGPTFPGCTPPPLDVTTLPPR
jgi:hypothetical protein